MIGWGRNNYGQCDIPEGLVAVQVAGGGWHSLAIADTLPPAASFTATPLAGTAPLAVQFTDTSTEDPTAWAWDFGDGETSTQQNPQHTYAEPGTYTVTLTATNAYGSDTKTMTDLITVYESGPYYIRTYDDLCKVGTGVDGWTLDADYIQTADIQCPAGENFTPIGNLSAPFSGTYDGGGYTIRDLYIYAPEDAFVGLFGDVKDGTGISFTNITLENISITAGGCIGGLVGWAGGDSTEYPILITNCNVSGDIKCNSGSGGACYGIGGLVGMIWPAIITNCHADVSISGDLLCYVGGLIGEAGDCTVTACSASGDIQLAGEYGGGLIGFAYLELILNDCHATGDVIGNQESLERNGAFGGLVGVFPRGSITNCSATGTVIGGGWYYGTGGLVGDLNSNYPGAEEVSVSGCYATGNVSGLRHTGGLIGAGGPAENYGIENCYATGNVASLAGRDPDDGYPDGSAGGLIGYWNPWYGAYLRNCYSTGTVTAPGLAAPAPYAGIGGLIGMIDSDNGGACTNCFWDTETSGQTTSAGGATGKTTAELQALATFAGWNIATPAEYTDEVWFLVEGEDYPRLAWEGLPTPEEPTPTATPTPGTLPGPLPVRFVVQSYTGQPLANITVTATPLESTGPWSWLYDLFGISGDADLTGTVLAGTTDSGGGIVFSLIQTVKYRVTVTDASRGIDTSITLYPQEDAVVISVWPQEPVGSAGDFTLYAEEEAAGTRVGVRYATADLVRVTFTVTTEARGVVYTAVSVAQGDDLSYLLDGEPGEVYLYGYVAELKTGEVVRQDQYIRFSPEARPWVDLAPWVPRGVYNWAAIAILVGFSWTFGRGEIRGALLTIPILSGILWLIGWLDVSWLLVGVILMLGILVYMRLAEEDLSL